MSQSQDAPPPFPLLTRGRFAGLRINNPVIPLWYIRRIAEDTSRPYLCICAQCVLSGDPAPKRDDIQVLALEAAKEKRKEVST
jgi:hypothetical protein